MINDIRMGWMSMVDTKSVVQDLISSGKVGRNCKLGRNYRIH